MLAVTGLYAGLLALLLLALSVAVIHGRREAKVGFGDGDNTMLARRIRGHGNFAEYVPMVLMLMAIAELNQVPEWRIHVVGAALLAGRLLHGYCFVCTESHPPTRAGGMVLTFAALLIGSLNCLWSVLA